MKKFNHIIFTIILIFALPCFAATEFTGKIISITDGDTVTVLNGKEQIRVRLYGIDCPD
jgi:micrococcal nuclease